MSEFQSKVVDVNDSESHELFEKAAFKAFESNLDDVSIQKIWRIDENNKIIKFPYPYEDLEVALFSAGEEILAAACINTNMKNTLQLEKLGFQVDKSESAIVEVVVLFVLTPMYNGSPIFFKVRDFIFPYLINKSIKKIYGTCNKQKFRGFKILDFRIIDTRVFDGKDEYLIVKDL